MTFDDLNEKWKKFVLWYQGQEKSMQLRLERIADSGYSFLIVVLVSVSCGVLLITFTTWLMRLK